VHKVKGLEAERVFLLKQTFQRHSLLGGFSYRVRTHSMPSREELNIEYVAITRAKTHLAWVDMQQATEPTTVLDGLSTDELITLRDHRERGALLAVDSDKAAELMKSVAMIDKLLAEKV
jgi:superfamily I DNA/RNA helicase